MTGKEAERRAAMPWETECPCPLPEEAGFSPQEIWAWEKRLSLGLVADMSEYSKTDKAGDDPNKAENWPKTRVLSEKFLRTILFHEPYKSAAPRPYIRISCARIPDALDFQGFALDAELGVHQSLFEGKIIFLGLTAKRLLSFQGSTFEEVFVADRLTVGGTLFLSGGATFKQDVRLLGASVGGNLETDSSTFEGEFTADGLTVGGDLFLSDVATFKQDVRLVGAKIGGDLTTAGSTFEGTFRADSLTVGGNLFLRGMKRFGDAEILGARIGGVLDLSGSTYDGHVNLTGTTVKGDILLASTKHKPPKWQQGARLTLRNVTAGALQDTEDAWRRQEGGDGDLVPLDLTGFDYERLGGLLAGEGGNIAHRPTDWFVKWIESPENHDKFFNPQPYQHLAATLRTGGQPDKADSILYAAKNHQLRAGDVGGWTKVKLWLLRGLIGYGYYNYRAVPWFLALVVLGALLVGFSVDLTAQYTAVFDRFWYSFDMALPIVKLNAEHKKHIAENWVAVYFYAHKMLGFVLASLLVAGLSGLTK